MAVLVFLSEIWENTSNLYVFEFLRVSTFFHGFTNYFLVFRAVSTRFYAGLFGEMLSTDLLESCSTCT